MNKSPGSEAAWKELKLKLMEAGSVDGTWSLRNRAEAPRFPSSSHPWMSYQPLLLRKLSPFPEHCAPAHKCTITTMCKAKESREAQEDEQMTHT